MSLTCLTCPTCRDTDQRSTVRIVPGKPPTQIPKVHYWDEQGVEHRHDPNVYRTKYRCSNGHRFEEISSWQCTSCSYMACEAKINVLGVSPERISE